MTDLLFRADGGVLRIEAASYLPDGLSLQGETLPWDGLGGLSHSMLPERWPGTPRTGWTIGYLQYNAAGNVYVHVAPGRDLPLAGAFATVAWHNAMIALALASFLRDEPRARDGLRDPRRLLALTKALRALPRVGSGLPREPLMGAKHDLHHSVIRAARSLLPRRYDDRRVDADPAPSLDEVVARARAGLPAYAERKFSDEDIAERARPYVELPPWPFSVLL